MILEPSLQTQLYGLDEIFNEIVHLFDNNKLPNKILLSGQKGSGKSTLSYHLANYIFSIKEENSYNLKSKEISINNTSYKLINNQSHPNFYLIDIKDDKKNIEISQIRKMINYANKSAFNNSARIIMINNVEHINNNSINALLKIIEEPNDNIFFILIHNNNKKILSTLRSRCLCFKLNLSFNESIEITNKLISNNIFDLINIDLINYYSTPGYYLRLINFARINSIDLNHFNLNDFLLYIIDKNFYKKDYLF